ncbi:MAG: putative membrane protein [Sediminicola sp.]
MKKTDLSSRLNLIKMSKINILKLLSFLLLNFSIIFYIMAILSFVDNKQQFIFGLCGGIGLNLIAISLIIQLRSLKVKEETNGTS